MKTYILIMVLSQGTNQGSNSTLSVEFSSLAQCVTAREKIAKDLESRYIYVNVMSAGCFEK